MKLECCVCAQEWATTYEEHLGPVCAGCKGHCAWADAALTDKTGICAPPQYGVLWWKCMKDIGEIISHSW